MTMSACSTLTGDEKHYIEATTKYPDKLIHHFKGEQSVELFYTDARNGFVVYNSQNIANATATFSDQQFIINFDSIEEKTDYYTSQVFEVQFPKNTEYLIVKVNNEALSALSIPLTIHNIDL